MTFGGRPIVPKELHHVHELIMMRSGGVMYVDRKKWSVTQYEEVSNGN